MVWGREWDRYEPKTKSCPVCGETMYEKTITVHDTRISSGKDYTEGTGEYYCPHCEEVAEQKAKEQAQKRYEERCKKYDDEYQEYLDIRKHDKLFTIELTFEEIKALRKTINTQDRFKDYDIHSAFNVLNRAYLGDIGDTVTQKQRNCIKLIEKNTKHKFYARTKESAREFISKYMKESKGVVR